MRDTLIEFLYFFKNAPLRTKIFTLLTAIYTAALGGFFFYGMAFETKSILYLVSGLGQIFSLLFWLNVLGGYLCIRYTRKLYRYGDDIGTSSFYIDAGFILIYSGIVIAASYILLNVNWGDL